MALNVVEQIDDRVRVERVLVSVSDKSGLDRLIPQMADVNPDITFYSTGGTYKVLCEILKDRDAGRVVSVSEYTGQPEMQGGLVKTLDFKIYLGLLSETYNEAHKQDMARVQAQPIDVVIANLYPFKATVAKADTTPENARANIDIGGPCMVRAAAKNFIRVASVTDPADYDGMVEELRAHGGTLGLDTRLRLARKAFAHTAEYDTAIAAYLAERSNDEVAACYTRR